MWVIGLVTLMLKSPATQSKKPKMPVIRLPQRKTVPSHCGSESLLAINGISPCKRTAGSRKIAEPRFVHQASSIVELPQYGRELLIKTAWMAMNSEERKP